MSGGATLKYFLRCKLSQNIIVPFITVRFFWHLQSRNWLIMHSTINVWLVYLACFTVKALGYQCGVHLSDFDLHMNTDLAKKIHGYTSRDLIYFSFDDYNGVSIHWSKSFATKRIEDSELVAPFCVENLPLKKIEVKFRNYHGKRIVQGIRLHSHQTKEQYHTIHDFGILPRSPLYSKCCVGWISLLREYYQ